MRMGSRPLRIDVFRASDILTTDGVMKGETISFADELVLDDTFQVIRGRQVQPLMLVSTDSGLHRAGAEALNVHLDCCLTLMGPDGDTHEALILVAVKDDHAADIYVMPLGDLAPLTDYRLVGIARHTATRRFAEAASGSFAKGTRITLCDGAMCPIEALREGDIVLTRDAGPQPVRRIIKATLRATGSFAPVVIAAGTLNNEGPLALRPDHRLFVYQRQDQLGAGRPEVLIKARHLVDGKKIIRRKGGFIDYYQLVFDDHHIIFAEGIAAESHLVDPAPPADLPDRASLPAAAPRYHDYEVSDPLIPPEEAARLLRAASAGQGAGAGGVTVPSAKITSAAGRRTPD